MQGSRTGSPTQNAVIKPDKSCISLNYSQIAQQIICNIVSSQKDGILGQIILFASMSSLFMKTSQLFKKKMKAGTGASYSSPGQSKIFKWLEVSREQNFKEADYCFSKLYASESTSRMGQVSLFEGNGYCFLKAHQRHLAGRQYSSGVRCLSAGTQIPYRGDACTFCSHTERKNSRVKKSRSDLLEKGHGRCKLRFFRRTKSQSLPADFLAGQKQCWWDKMPTDLKELFGKASTDTYTKSQGLQNQCLKSIISKGSDTDTI